MISRVCPGSKRTALMSRHWPLGAAWSKEEGRVGFRAMIVAANLDGAIAGVGDGEHGAGQAEVHLDVAG